jgi:hypothetical protein
MSVAEHRQQLAGAAFTPRPRPRHSAVVVLDEDRELAAGARRERECCFSTAC